MDGAVTAAATRREYVYMLASLRNTPETLGRGNQERQGVRHALEYIEIIGRGEFAGEEPLGVGAKPERTCNYASGQPNDGIVSSNSLLHMESNIIISIMKK